MPAHAWYVGEHIRLEGDADEQEGQVQQFLENQIRLPLDNQ